MCAVAEGVGASKVRQVTGVVLMLHVQEDRLETRRVVTQLVQVSGC